MSLDMYACVKNFHEVFGHPAPPSPTLTPYNDAVRDAALKNLRLDLIQEEFDELKEALVKQSLVGVADALGDILVVTLGAAIVFGIDIRPVFEEIHRANMSKLGADGRPIYRADGKILKSDLYTPPDLRPIIAQQLAR